MNISELKTCLNNINEVDLDKLKSIILSYSEIIILGNGGSNAISSHISQDYTKTLNKRAISFSDSSRLTCYINDYGMDMAYVKFIEHFSNKNTLVILISSSGNSSNIINSARHCLHNNIDIITLSGFDRNNKLNSIYGHKMPLLSFWIDSKDYGIVECLHEIILHSVI